MLETVPAHNQRSKETGGRALGARPGVFTIHLSGLRLRLAVFAVQSAAWKEECRLPCRRAAAHTQLLVSGRHPAVSHHHSSMEIPPLTDCGSSGGLLTLAGDHFQALI